MGKPANKEFDPKVFLAKVGAGKTILKFEKNQHVFEQGDVADIRAAKVADLIYRKANATSCAEITSPGT